MEFESSDPAHTDQLKVQQIDIEDSDNSNCSLPTTAIEIKSTHQHQVVQH